MILRDQGERVRAPLLVGPYGGQSRDWTAATSTTYPCELQPVDTRELVDAQQRTEGRWRLFLAANVDLHATDRWRHQDVTYEVDGEPQVHRLRGAVHHLEAQLKRIDEG